MRSKQKRQKRQAQSKSFASPTLISALGNRRLQVTYVPLLAVGKEKARDRRL